MAEKLMLLAVLLCLAVSQVSCAPQAGGQRRRGGIGPEVTFVKSYDKVDVMMDGELFTSYLFGRELTKPVLFPVRTPSGVVVTRSYPLGERVEGESEDHAHHMGVFFTYDRVNDERFWNNKEIPPQIRHVKFKETTSGRGEGRLSVVMEWIGRNGRAVLQEDRTMVFLQGDGENIIDFGIDLTALDEKVVFEDTKEGMFAIRVAHWLRERAGKEWPEGMLPTARYFSSSGDRTAKNVWARRAKWVALEGEKDGRTFGIAILNHSSSVNYPTYWHARDYGLFSADPLGQGYFQKARKLDTCEYLNLTLEPGEKAHFGFRMIFYEGPRTKEQLERRFAEYLGRKN